jgi:hypothetical protein
MLYDIGRDSKQSQMSIKAPLFSARICLKDLINEATNKRIHNNCVDFHCQPLSLSRGREEKGGGGGGEGQTLIPFIAIKVISGGENLILMNVTLEVFHHMTTLVMR